MPESNSLILEIFKQDSFLKMSLYEEKELSLTLRHYSLARVSFPEIKRLSQEVALTLNKTEKNGSLDPFLIKRLSKTGQLLWDHLLTPSVKNKLRSSPIMDLILSIDEELIDIPWELLYDGTNFLCLTFNLGRLVRTKKEAATVQYRSFSTTPKMLILANPTRDLKSAYLEGVNIKNQFDRRRNNIHIDFKSTSIDKVYAKKNLRDYDIVHFAGHYEYESGNPQESGWIFMDGKFTVQDILSMGSTVPLPSLIFSNACYSALIPENSLSIDYQEKVYTLAQAFLFSGVRHYIGSIRKIEDAASLAFAKEFYTQLILGKTVGESIRLGRLKLVKEYGIMAISWASYLLYGDPNFVLFRTKTKSVAERRRKWPLIKKKQILGFSLALALVSISIYLYTWLPSLNPTTYYLFLKSKKAFLKGRNEEALLFSGRIIKKEPLFLAAYPLLGDTYYRLGDRENAIKQYFNYVLYSQKTQDKKNLVSAYIGLGWIYYLQGEYAKAFDFYTKALNLSREEKDKLSEADVLGKLAIWYMDKNDNDRALELLTKSTAINRERQNIYKHKYNLACDYFNLGLLFTNKDDLATAEEFYNKSFAIFNKLKLTYELSDYYFNMGEIYLFQKEYQKSMDCYRKGLKIDQAQNNQPSLASDYDMIGELYVAMDNLKEAENYFNRSIQIASQINARPELASAYYNLGLLYKKINKKNKAREYLRLAQEIYSVMDEARYQETKRELLGLSGG